MSPPASGTASDVRVDYIHCVLFVGATLPCAAWCVQEDRPNLEGMAILTAMPPYLLHAQCFRRLGMEWV